MIKLINGDCIEVMKDMINRGVKVDMILADNPYQETANPNDKRIPMGEMWDCYNALIKDNGVIALFAQGLFYVDLINANRKYFRYDLCWDKQMTTGFLNSKRMPLRSHEQIAIFYKKLPYYNPIFEQGKPLHSKGKGYASKEIKNQNYGKFSHTDDARAGSTDKYPRSIWVCKKDHPSVVLHPTQKPVALLQKLIETYTRPGETVLDNCMGSCSTGVACLNTGRHFIGIEINREYYDIAQRRINGNN